MTFPRTCSLGGRGQRWDLKDHKHPGTVARLVGASYLGWESIPGQGAYGKQRTDVSLPLSPFLSTSLPLYLK